MRRQISLPGLAVPAVVAGLDEAGRGCLAGPVAAAAVILPENAELPGLADSKKLSAARRDILAARIKGIALAWAVAYVWPRRIEKINILQASLLAMAQAASRLFPLPGLLLLDGNQRISRPLLSAIWPGPLPGQRAVVHGDASIAAISAASILAKTSRDSLMERLDKRWPLYGFARHKGYGTRAHYAALAEYGPCPLHRMTFCLHKEPK